MLDGSKPKEDSISARGHDIFIDEVSDDEGTGPDMRFTTDKDAARMRGYEKSKYNFDSQGY